VRWSGTLPRDSIPWFVGGDATGTSSAADTTAPPTSSEAANKNDAIELQEDFSRHDVFI
jgi:hypothetical protein